MIGLLILAQKDFGRGLLSSVEHVLGKLPPQLAALPIDYEQEPEQLAALLRQNLARLDQGEGVLILADIYGATHTNVACGLLRKNEIELVAGVNLPMLIRILNYRHLDLPRLMDKALTGGPEGIVCPNPSNRLAERGR